MEQLPVRDLFTIGVNVALVTAVIVSNKNHVTQLKEQNSELKSWLKSLQETVNNLRVKVGMVEK